MASSGQIKGITIKITGDTDGLAKDLQAVNSDIKKTAAALKDVEKALELDPGNVELLAAKQDLLNKQIEQTSQKLALEQQAAEQARDALEIGDISAEEYATLAAEVTQTQNSLDELTGSADSSADSIEGTGAAASEAGDEAEDSGQSFVSWGDMVEGAAAAAATAVAAVGAAAAAMAGVVAEGASALIDMAGDVKDMGDEIDKTAQKVNLTNAEYQRLDYIMKIAGSSMSENIQGFKTLNNAFDDAINGSSTAAAKFERLGLSISDIRDMSTGDLFTTVINSLQGMENASERAAIANDLLGRSSINLMPLLNMSADDMAALSNQAEEYGLIMSDDLVADSAAYQDALTLMDGALTGLKNRMVGEFLPGLTTVTTGLAGMAAGIDGSEQEVAAGIEEIVNTFQTMAPGILNAIDTMLPSLLELGMTLITTIANGVITEMPLLLETAFNILSSLTGALLDPANLEMILNSAVEILLQLVNGLIGAIDMLIEPAINAVMTLVNGLLSSDSIGNLTEAAIHIIITLLNALTDATPDLIPAAVAAVGTIVAGLADHYDEIILAAEDAIAAIIDGLIEALPELLGVIIGDIVPSMLEAFMTIQQTLPKKALEWGADLIASLVKGITNAIPKLTQGVKRVADTIASYLHFTVPDIGPLSDFDKSGGDMIDVFVKGMQGADYELERALNATGEIIYNGITGAAPDYTGQLRGISTQLAGIGGQAAAGGTYVINVMVGNTRLAQAVISAEQMEMLRTGGN